MTPIKIVFTSLFMLYLCASTTFAEHSSAASKEETRTVDWYMAPENKAALEAKLKECRNNPGELKDTAQCQNAVQADLKLFTNQPGINIR